jgi:hypothetical protein
MLNISYLASLNLLDEHRNLAYNPAEDRFIYQGVNYISAGDTPVSQVLSDNIWFYLILKRVDFAT